MALKRGAHGTIFWPVPVGTVAQAYTEYVVILAVLFAAGIAFASVFTGVDAIQDIFYGYYASLSNYINLPFF